METDQNRHGATFFLPLLCVFFPSYLPQHRHFAVAKAHTTAPAPKDALVATNRKAKRQKHGRHDGSDPSPLPSKGNMLPSIHTNCAQHMPCDGIDPPFPGSQPDASPLMLTGHPSNNRGVIRLHRGDLVETIPPGWYLDVTPLSTESVTTDYDTT